MENKRYTLSAEKTSGGTVKGRRRGPPVIRCFLTTHIICILKLISEIRLVIRDGAKADMQVSLEMQAASGEWRLEKQTQMYSSKGYKPNSG